MFKKIVLSLLFSMVLCVSAQAYMLQLSDCLANYPDSRIIHFYIEVFDTASNISFDTQGSQFDPMMYLYSVDDYPNYIDWDDDSGFNVESHINAYLNTGVYGVAVSPWYFSDVEFEQNSNLNSSSYTGCGETTLLVVSSYNNIREYNPAPVPEPATFLLLGIGLTGVVLARKQRK